MSTKKLTVAQAATVGVTLFSMFFGAGNLILPPLLGLQAGSDIVPAVAGFLVTGIGLPILGVISVALAGTVRALADRVHPLYSRSSPCCPTACPSRPLASSSRCSSSASPSCWRFIPVG